MARSSSSDALEKFRFLVDFSFEGTNTSTPNPDTATDANAKLNTSVRCGFHDIQMPKRSTNKVMYREGHEAAINTKSAGLSDFEDVVMSRGVIAGDGAAANDFLRWCQSVHKPTSGMKGYGAGEGQSALTQASVLYRGEVTIQMLDRAGTVVRAWKLHQAFPVNFVPGSDLNAGEDGEKSMEALTICYEDFQEMKVDKGAIGDPL
jgi:phage tail-like protein